MEPKDLNNPEGLESGQDAKKKKNAETAASNEQIENNEKAEESVKENKPVEQKTAESEKEKKTEDVDSEEEKSAETELQKEEHAPAVKPEEKVKEDEGNATQPEPDKPAEHPENAEVSADNETADSTDSEVEPVVEEFVKEEDSPTGKKAEGEEDSVGKETVPADNQPKSEPENDEPKKEYPDTPPKEEDVIAAPAPGKEKAEKKEVKKPAPAQKEKPDYSAYSQIELVNAMRDVLDSNGDHDIRDEVEAIRAAFYRSVKEEVEARKKQFLEEGGDEDEFEPEENPYEQDIKDLLKRYRQIRHEYNKKLEQEKEVNLQLKYDIIEEIKGLIHKEESINKTFQDFRDLQQRWREIGLVPQSKMKDLWDTYHFHVENFYDYIKINKELRDLDLKKNLEMKIRLCEQAEELLLEPNTVKAFNQLQKLHERWREIGPVPRENKDDIWERFKAATAKINKKYQEYFENRKAEQKKNLEAKRALCEQVEEINGMELNSYKEWAEKSREVVNLQKVWRTIGFAPRKDNNKIYKRFREDCDKFFDAKREFYAKNKELQQNNLQLKTDLCLQAEALKDSDDWRKTTQDLINIQKQWKEIGPVPRKHSEALWKRFRAACDYFFNRKSEHFSSIDSEQEENLKEKEQLIKEVESFESTGDVDENLRILKDFQRRWTEIGHVPIKKKDEIQKQFRDAINKLFDDLNLDESKRNLLKFRTKMASFSESSRGQNKMRLERDKYMNKLKQLENDLVLLDNNIGFFAKSKNAETLIKDVKRQIEQTKEKIELLKDKIRVIDEMDQSEE
jgi:hypothetical protein